MPYAMPEANNMFNQCIPVILKNEGGFVNDPNDPGGKTRYGISDRADGNIDGMIDIDRDGTGDVKVETITVDQAKQIYFEKYWKPLNIQGIEDINAALQIFDFAVNAGVNRSVITAQRLAGVRVDGVIGPVTINAINKMGTCFLTRFIYARKEYYNYLANRKPSLGKYLQGWINRVEHTKIYV